MKEYLPALKTLRRVEIGFAGTGYPPPPAWLFTGWLATRLAWTFQGVDRGEIRFRSGSGDVTVVMRGTGSRGGRALERIAIRSDKPHPLEMEITHKGRDVTATIVTGTPGARRADVPFGYREFAACIVGELHRHAPNRSLEDAVRVAERLMSEWRGE